MTKQLYWIIASLSVLIATLLGLFIFPFISWLTNCREGLVPTLLIIGGVLLIASIIFFFKKSCNKLIAMILFPLFLFFSLSGFIQYVRFDFRFPKSHYEFLGYHTGFGNYVYYTKFGLKTEIKGRIIGVAYNEYREKLYISQIVREESEWDEWDNEYDYKYWVKGVVYDEDGNYVDQTDEKYYYFEEDSYDYENRREIFENYIKNTLYDYGIKMM